MKEEFLHFVWQTKQFNAAGLAIKDGTPLEVINPGIYNRDAGPDFFNAQIKTGDQLWIGNVEIHVNASDWTKHKHEDDPAYNNVILHVVFNDDAPVKTNSGLLMPTLELKDRINKKQYIRFLRLYSSKDEIPCVKKIAEVEKVLITSWISRLLVERLERKVNLLKMELEHAGNDWDELFYRHMVRQFGMKVNAEPFQWLAAAAPFRLMARQNDNLLQTEALLFGQAGLLPGKQEDVYSGALIREYAHLKLKYEMQPMEAQSWKFMRLRPNNFPTVRIAQLAGLLYRRERLFTQCMQTKTIKKLHELLDVPASGYWETHYRFGKSSGRKPKRLGSQTIDSILINTIVPFKFLYGKHKSDQQLCSDALSLLDAIAAEDNRVIRTWKNLQIIPGNAGESQALVELTTNYCEKRKCLDCAIGCSLISRAAG
ncbi:MAG TPA: DUF2851 family protein [Bacteroidia bacterium]|nr:DUF2851 family protein [Bacteroidia bacterium]